jgi:hypothetical protein
MIPGWFLIMPILVESREGSELVAVEEKGDSRWVLVYQWEKDVWVLPSEFLCDLIDEEEVGIV